MSKDIIPTKKKSVYNEQTKEYDRIDVEIPPIRRVVDEIRTERKGWFGKRTWLYDTVSKTESLEYFWKGEWQPIPTEWNVQDID